MYVPVFFKPEEFAKCNPSCSMSDMDVNLLVMLDNLRSMCGFSLMLNSAYRSPDWDKAKGRSGSGPHTKGMGVDISCRDSYHRAVILEHAIKLKFHGIGIADSYIHLDIVPRQYGPLVWVY